MWVDAQLKKKKGSEKRPFTQYFDLIINTSQLFQEII